MYVSFILVMLYFFHCSIPLWYNYLIIKLKLISFSLSLQALSVWTSVTASCVGAVQASQVLAVRQTLMTVPGTRAEMLAPAWMASTTSPARAHSASLARTVQCALAPARSSPVTMVARVTHTSLALYASAHRASWAHDVSTPSRIHRTPPNRPFHQERMVSLLRWPSPVPLAWSHSPCWCVHPSLFSASSAVAGE